jgi:hypothetical protein
VLLLPTAAGAYTVRQTATGEDVHWTTRTLSVSIDRSMREIAHLSDVREALDEATAAWTATGEGPVLSVETDPLDGDPNPADGVVGVYCPSRWPADPDYLGVTVSTYVAATGVLVDADILLNDRKPFERFDVEGPPDDCILDHREDNAYDLDSVLTHELGHVLGLGESMDDPEATMWPRLAKRTVHPRSLATDDVDGVTSIYASLAPPTESAASCSASRGPIGGLALVGAAALLLLLRRRRNVGASPLPFVLAAVLALVASPALGKPTEDDPAGLTLLRHRDVENVRYSVFETTDANGDPIAVEVPGARWDGLVQRVGDEEPPLPGTPATFRQDRAGDAGWLHLVDGRRVRAFVAR